MLGTVLPTHMRTCVRIPVIHARKPSLLEVCNSSYEGLETGRLLETWRLIEDARVSLWPLQAHTQHIHLHTKGLKKRIARHWAQCRTCVISDLSNGSKTVMSSGLFLATCKFKTNLGFRRLNLKNKKQTKLKALKKAEVK